MPKELHDLLGDQYEPLKQKLEKQYAHLPEPDKSRVIYSTMWNIAHKTPKKLFKSPPRTFDPKKYGMR